MAVLLGWQLFELRRTLRGRVAAVILVAVLCWSDAVNFRHAFLERGIFDPVTNALLHLRGMVPQMRR